MAAKSAILYVTSDWVAGKSVIGSLRASHERERPGAHLLSRAEQGIPFGKPGPDLLARGLRLATDRFEVDARDRAVAHAHDPVDDDGLDVVADSALDQALDG